MDINNLLKPEHKDAYLIYTRKSTDDTQNQKNSIDFQMGEAISFSRKNNLKIADITIPGFCEDGIIREKHSGYKQNGKFEISEGGQVSQQIERPKFLTLVRILNKHMVKGVICLCWDRISRNENDDVLVKKLIGSGIDLQFIQVSYDRTSSGALHMDIDGMFSRHYSRVISEKVTNATRKLRSQGRCTYRAPVGYLNNGSDNKPLDPETAPLVKKMFEMYAEGDMGIIPLMHWANEQGLTCQPRRRKRTKEEYQNEINLEDLPKVSRPLSKRGVEEILKNYFYIGKVKDRGNYIDGLHQPLIDTSLFFKVQAVMQTKTTIKHKPYMDFHTYRGLVRCGGCGRLYCPYEQKGINYLMLKCKPNCPNQIRNVSESVISDAIQKLIAKLSFTEDELRQLEAESHTQLNKITDRRNQELRDVYDKLNKVMKDYDYLCAEKLSFLRNQVMTVEEIKKEELRLHVEIEKCQQFIKTSAESSRSMLDYLITFSELIKGASAYFQFALDNEKREIANKIFSELYFLNGELKFKAKQGFNALFCRLDHSTDPIGAAPGNRTLIHCLEGSYSTTKLAPQVSLS